MTVPGVTPTEPLTARPAWKALQEHYQIENYRTGLVWRLMRDCPYVVSGLRRAGFTGGWLSAGVESR